MGETGPSLSYNVEHEGISVPLVLALEFGLRESLFGVDEPLVVLEFVFSLALRL